MNERFLIVLGLGAAALLASQSGESAQSPAVESEPADPVDMAGSVGLGGLGELGATVQSGYYTPSNWYDLNQYLKIYIPFRTRSIATGPNSGKVQFLYNGRWYDALNLLRVWNPIRSLPSYLR